MTRILRGAELAVFDALFRSVAEEMGEALMRSATSVNIKERRDLSCALFDGAGALVAQAAHIPVHLGAMPLSVAAALERRPPGPGDVVLLNDPWAGGTHLPDLTAVARAGGFLVANRAHHADVGGAAPGSLGQAFDIHGEGLRIPPVRLVRRGEFDEDLLDLFCANVRAPRERREDLIAQVETLRRGQARLAEAAASVGEEELLAAAGALREAARRAAQETIRGLQGGEHRFEDFLDDGTALRVVLRIDTVAGRLCADFTGTDPQVAAPLNANLAVTQSALAYVFALLLPPETPLNEGVRDVLDVVAPEGTVVHARYPSPVAGGNVETSQRIVDVLLGALDGAAPGRVPAASQGTMNNVTAGGAAFSYYETIAGGMGGGPQGSGASALHSHMTNTRNTPVEALENETSLVVRALRVRPHSGGRGTHPGGDGVLREMEFTEDGTLNLLSERRTRGPYGLHGGESGRPGRNTLIRDGEEIPLDGRASIRVRPGDRLRIETPGGGGWGAPA